MSNLTGEDSLAEVFKGFLLAAAILLSLGLILAFILPDDPGPVTNALTAQFIRGAYNLRPEPAERTIFFVLAATGPLVLASWHYRRNIGFTRNWEIPIGVWLVISIIGASSSSILRFMYEPFSRSIPWILSCAIGAAAAAWALIRHRQNRHRPGPGQLHVWILVLAALASAFFIATWKWFDIHALNDHPTFTFHFSAVYYAVSQSVAGNVPLADFTSIYGFFGELLAPWFRLIGLSIGSFTATLAAIQWLGFVCLFFFGFRTFRNAGIFAAYCATVLVFAQTWAVLQDQGDPYFQYWPVRFIFPALSLLLFRAWWRHDSKLLLTFIGVVSGISILWNIDSGVAVVGTFAGVSFFRRMTDSPIRARSRWQSLFADWSILLGAVTAVFLLFFAVLRFRAGFWVSPSGLLKFQHLFYEAGYYMLPLPARPHFWHLIVALFLFGLSASIHATKLANAAVRENAATLFFLTVLGIGLFPYYQGRSHDYVMTSILWPVATLFFLFLDLLLPLARRGLIRKSLAGLILWPGLFIGIFSAVLLTGSAPRLWKHAVALRQKPQTPVVQDSHFIGRQMGAFRECAILSRHQATFLGENGLKSSLKGPGVDEGQLILQSDLDQINEQLLKSEPRDLFIDSYWLPDAPNNPFAGGLKNLRQRYRLAAVSPTGRIHHFVRLR